MSYRKIHSIQFNGLRSCPISVEAVKLRGGRSLHISGFAQGWLKESKDKIVATVTQNVEWGPMDKVLIHLLPVHEIKRSAHLELPIALACIAVLYEGDLPESTRQFFEKHLFSSALSLKGDLVDTELNKLIKQMKSSSKELVGAQNFTNIVDLWQFALKGKDQALPIAQKPSKNHSHTAKEKEGTCVVDGRYWERLALAVAAVAEEAVLLLGQPGVGKSFLAQWASTLFAHSSQKIQEESEMIWTLSETFQKKKFPVLNPHAKSHLSEFVGVKRNELDRPGYFALAHGGCLVLDEYSEMNRDCRELLRNILDHRVLKRNTKSSQITWPTRFWLILTSNPCPCGMSAGDDLSQCRCTESSRRAYQNRISGPILDRMGVKLFVDRTDRSQGLQQNYSFLDQNPVQLRDRIVEARSEMGAYREEAAETLSALFEKLRLNPRTQNKKIKIYCAFRALTQKSPEEALRWTHLITASEKNLLGGSF